VHTLLSLIFCSISIFLYIVYVVLDTLELICFYSSMHHIEIEIDELV